MAASAGCLNGDYWDLGRILGILCWLFGVLVFVLGWWVCRRVPASAGIPRAFRCAPCAPPSFRFAPRKGLVARALTLGISGIPCVLSLLPFGKGKDGVMRARLVAKGAEVG